MVGSNILSRIFLFLGIREVSGVVVKGYYLLVLLWQ